MLINTRVVSCVVQGKGKDVVLLHGFMESADIWADYILELSDDYRVIAIDLPGHGGAHQFGEIHRMDDMAKVVHHVLVNHGVDKCTMVGHSMGGYVALEFAALFPGMLSGLCLFHSNANEDSSEARLNRNRAISFVRQNRKGFTTQFIPELFAPENREKYADEIETLKERASAMSAESIIAAMEGMKIRRQHYQTLADLKAPVLFIIGQKDSRADMQLMMEQVILPAESHVLLLRDCGHMGYIENRDECLEAIRNISY